MDILIKLNNLMEIFFYSISLTFIVWEIFVLFNLDLFLCYNTSEVSGPLGKLINHIHFIYVFWLLVGLIWFEPLWGFTIILGLTVIPKQTKSYLIFDSLCSIIILINIFLWFLRNFLNVNG